MFVRQNQQQFRNSNADVKIFYGSYTSSTFGVTEYTWNKPPGVSHVYMMLIGAGGNGDGITGGGSGTVTVWFGSAKNVPDILNVSVAFDQTPIATTVFYYSSNGRNILLQADCGSGITGGGSPTPNTFGNSGFYKSTAGQNGSAGDPGPRATSFLNGGGGSGTTTSNYGYAATTSKSGYFMMQPIIVGVGGAGTGSASGGIGCGGALTGKGGPGMVLIASW